MSGATRIYCERFSSDYGDPWEMWSVVSRFQDAVGRPRTTGLQLEVRPFEILLTFEAGTDGISVTALSIAAPRERPETPARYPNEAQLMALLASNIGVAENDLLFPLRMHCRLLPEILSDFPTVSAALQNSKSAEAIQRYLESGDQQLFAELRKVEP